MSIDTGITLTVYADKYYRYEIDVSGGLSLFYLENGEIHTTIGFGSIDEMEAVANALLKAVKFVKEQ